MVPSGQAIYFQNPKDKLPHCALPWSCFQQPFLLVKGSGVSCSPHLRDCIFPWVPYSVNAQIYLRTQDAGFPPDLSSLTTQQQTSYQESLPLYFKGPVCRNSPDRTHLTPHETVHAHSLPPLNCKGPSHNTQLIPRKAS